VAAVFGWPKEYFAHLCDVFAGMDGVVNEMETLAWAAMLTGILIGVGVIVLFKKKFQSMAGRRLRGSGTDANR